MKTKALVTRDNLSFALENVMLSEVGRYDIMVRTVSSGVSIGTELALIRGKLSWGPYPLVTGYQATGIIEKAGRDVRNLKEGDRVFVRGNKSITLGNGVKATSANGAHASHIVCDASPGSPNAPGLVPVNVDMGTASIYVMPAVALHAVDMAGPSALETVAVYGAGQIGIGVTTMAAMRGCRVISIDIEKRALDLAAVMGAEHTVDASRDNWRKQFDGLAPEGADVVFEATGIPGCVDSAISLVRRTPLQHLHGQGKFVYLGNYGSGPISHDFLQAHVRQIQCFYPCDDGKLPNRNRIMQMLSRGILNWDRTITHRLPAFKAPETFEAIKNGDREFTGVVFNWQEA